MTFFSQNLREDSFCSNSMFKLILTHQSYINRYSIKTKCFFSQKAGEGNELIVGGKRMGRRRYLVINPSPAPSSAPKLFYHQPSSWPVKSVFGGSLLALNGGGWGRGGNRLWSYLGPPPRGLNQPTPNSAERGKRKSLQNIFSSNIKL